MTTMTTHSEFCDDYRCDGGCNEVLLECTDCGEDHLFEEGAETASLGTDCEQDECDGKLAYPGVVCDEQAAERRQMGLSNF